MLRWSFLKAAARPAKVTPQAHARTDNLPAQTQQLRESGLSRAIGRDGMFDYLSGLAAGESYVMG
jgi:hypothetical protein